MSVNQTLPEQKIELPLLPLRDVVVFPHMVIPLFVGRAKSIKALEVAMESDKSILLVAQKSATKDEPRDSDMYEIGCVANILQMLKLPDGTVKVLVEGTQRARIQTMHDTGSHFVGTAVPVLVDPTQTAETEAMRRALLSQFDQYVKLNKKIAPEVLASLSSIEEVGRLSDMIAAHLPLKLEQKQAILEMSGIHQRLEHLLGQLESEIDILRLKSASVDVSSGRWRKASASTTSTSRSRPSRKNSAKVKTAPTWKSSSGKSKPPK